MLTDEEILELVFWPKGSLTAQELRTILNTVRRFIDFDGTICAAWPSRDDATLRGKPLKEFLAEAPFIVQTWNSRGAMNFFVNEFPDLPKPVLIMAIPCFFYIDKTGEQDVGKDFKALGIQGATIIDDLKPEEIHAPGCTVLPPND